MKRTNFTESLTSLRVASSRTKNVLIILLSSVLLASCHLCSSQWAVTNYSTAWATIGGSPLGNYYSSAIIGTTLKLSWTRHTSMQITSSPAISDYHTASITGNPKSGCSFYTLDIFSGRSSFCRHVGKNNGANNPLVDHYGNIYTGSRDTLVAYDWFGPMRWKQHIIGNPIALEFIVPGILVAVVAEGRAYILDAHRGDILEIIDLPHQIPSHPSDPAQNSVDQAPADQRLKKHPVSDTLIAPIIVDQRHNLFFLLARHHLWAYRTHIAPQLRKPLDPQREIFHPDKVRIPSFTAQSQLLWHRYFVDSLEQLALIPTLDPATFHPAEVLGSVLGLLCALSNSHIIFIDPRSGQDVASNFINTSSEIPATAFSIDNDYHLVTSTSTELTIYSLNTQSYQPSWHVHDLHPCSRPVQLKNQKLLVINTINNVTELVEIDTTTGHRIASLNLPPEVSCENYDATLAISDVGTIVVTTTNGLILGITT